MELCEMKSQSEKCRHAEDIIERCKWDLDLSIDLIDEGQSYEI